MLNKETRSRSSIARKLSKCVFFSWLLGPRLEHYCLPWMCPDFFVVVHLLRSSGGSILDPVCGCEASCTMKQGISAPRIS